jgi:hypothetical protein
LTPPSPAQTTPATPLAGFAAGPPVGIGWLEGSTWHSGQGDTLQLPAGSYSAITPLRGGFLVTQPRDNASALSGAVGDVTWLDNTMHPQWTACGSERLAISGDQMITGWSQLSACTAAATDKLHTAISNGMGEGQTNLPVPSGQLAEPVGQTDQVLVYNLLGLTDGLPGGAWYADLAGKTALRRIPGLSQAASVNTSAQQVAGPSDADPHTGTVVSLPGGSTVWSKPGWGLGSFTADGKYVQGAESSGAPPTRYAILDARTGNIVQSLDLSNDDITVVSTAWDTDDSLLLLVSQGDRQAILRLTPSGHVTRASTVMPYDPRHAVVFATQP